MNTLRIQQPFVTGLLILLCIAAYAILADQRTLTSETLADCWVYLDPGRIWAGGYWTLLTANFIHVQFFHLLFNMAWLWALGRRVEAALGHQELFAVLFFAALVSAGTQLALGTWPSLGASGMVFALFGLMLGARRQIPLFALYLQPAVLRLLLGWLLLSVLIADAGVWPIGAVAQPAGFVFGWAVAALFINRRVRVAGAALLATLGLLTITSLNWLPWSPAWLGWRFLQSSKAGHYVEALALMEPLARTGHPVALNAIAWTRATAREPSLRDGRQAIELARQALTRTEWREPIIIDTLAAAYAEDGQWTRAEAWEVLALKTLSEQRAAPESELLDDSGAAGLDEAAYRERLGPLEANLVKIRRPEKIRE